MTDPLISVLDAQTLGIAVPDLITKDGDAAIKLRSTAVDIRRTDTSWRVIFSRQEITTLPSGKKVLAILEPFVDELPDVAGKVVTLKHPDGREFVLPVVLAHAIIAQYYVERELAVKA